jgi:N-acetyl-gamma-glutamylphosphate reductase
MHQCYNLIQAAKGEAAKVAVLGASGYTGAEVVRLTALHPGIQVTALTGEKQAGKVRKQSSPFHGKHEPLTPLTQTELFRSLPSPCDCNQCSEARQD